MTSDPTSPKSELFDQVEDAITALGRGEMVVVVDDENLDNEGNLIMAAAFATEEKVAFFVAHTSGIICAPLSEERADELELPLMVSADAEATEEAFTVTVDYRNRTSAGISAADRAKTLTKMADRRSVAKEFSRPGHVFPLRARNGGVLKRAGRAEAAVDLAKMAGLAPVGVVSELVKPDGTMAQVADLVQFCAEHNLKFVTIADIVRYRRRTEKLVDRISEAVIPTRHGDFRAVVFQSKLDNIQHVAFVRGEPDGERETLVRVHSECLTGDIFGSLRCDCGPQLDQALEKIARHGEGAVVYLRGHEGRGIGLAHKIRAYSLQDQGFDTVDANLQLGLPADSREYGIGAQMLVDLGVRRIRLMTNNPAKYTGLQGFGLEITERVSAETAPTVQNIAYLRTKQERMGHILDFGDDGDHSSAQ